VIEIGHRAWDLQYPNVSHPYWRQSAHTTFVVVLKKFLIKQDADQITEDSEDSIT
jgi:hypothetical protein